MERELNLLKKEFVELSQVLKSTLAEEGRESASRHNGLVAGLRERDSYDDLRMEKLCKRVDHHRLELDKEREWVASLEGRMEAMEAHCTLLEAQMIAMADQSCGDGGTTPLPLPAVPLGEGDKVLGAPEEIQAGEASSDSNSAERDTSFN